MDKLEADGIELSFGTRKILSSIYIKCQTNSVTGLLARNGEGKSCLMNIIYGTLKAPSKSIRFNDKSIFDAFKRQDLITYLPQFNFIPNGLTLQNAFNDFEIDFNEFVVAFDEFKDKGKNQIKNLSGGERRLAEVYLIIKSKSQFSMLDEPFSHIMPLHIEKIKKLLLTEKEKKGFLITDHMYKNIIEISDILHLLRDGKTYLTKTAEDLEFLGYLNIDQVF